MKNGHVMEGGSDCGNMLSSAGMGDQPRTPDPAPGGALDTQYVPGESVLLQAEGLGLVGSLADQQPWWGHEECLTQRLL